eukprot:4539366-Pyramimonas_sp.AAC.1
MRQVDQPGAPAGAARLRRPLRGGCVRVGAAASTHQLDYHQRTSLTIVNTSATPYHTPQPYDPATLYPINALQVVFAASIDQSVWLAGPKARVAVGWKHLTTHPPLTGLGKLLLGLARFDTVWHSLTRFDTVWHSLTRFGTVWHGLA